MDSGISESSIYLLVKYKDTRLGRNITGASKEYGINEVYNVYYSGYENGIVRDAYLAEEDKEFILFEDAEIF